VKDVDQKQSKATDHIKKIFILGGTGR